MYNKAVADDILSALAGANFPANVLPLSFAQSAFETAGFTDPAGPANDTNNYSGITYGGSAGQLATGAFKMPDTRFAGYGSINEWASDFYRVLCFNHGSGRPIDATGLNDYVIRLKANGYFGNDGFDIYYNGVKKWYDILSSDYPEIFNTGSIAQSFTQVADNIGLIDKTDYDTTASDDPKNTKSNLVRNNIIIVSGAALIIMLCAFLIIISSKNDN